MTTVGLFDSLVFDRPEGPAGIALECDTPGIPTDERNLVVALARRLRDKAAVSDGVHIRLRKRIPAGGGLAGGSSDGATTLLALREFWSITVTTDRLIELASEVGSDIAFFFHAPSAWCEGRGELVTPLAAPRPTAALLMLPHDLAMSTPQVYRQFDVMNLGSDLREGTGVNPPTHPWLSLDAERLLPELRNDLETPAFALCPELGHRRDELEQLLERPVRMSGSGSTLFTLYDTSEEAESAAQRLAGQARLRVIPAELAPGRSTPGV